MKGWWEIDKKISAGRKEAAGVYYRQAPESDKDELLVWVRMSATQREDIAKMNWTVCQGRLRKAFS